MWLQKDLFSLFVFNLIIFQKGYGAPTRTIGSESDLHDQSPKVSLFEGDIAGIKFDSSLSKDEILAVLSQKVRNGVLDSEYRWPSGVIPYEISPYFTQSERQLLLSALEEINNRTAGVRVVRRTSDEPNYVYIGRGGQNSGCWSYVGRIGGEQYLNLETAAQPGDPHCMHHGIIIHEMLHAIGFWHEQSRTDRDNHVEINWDNIERNQQHNFDSYGNQTVTAFGQPYDYGSLMHYGKYDFAKNRSIWTIRPLPPFQDTDIGQRRGLSAIDIVKLDAMYPPLSKQNQ